MNLFQAANGTAAFLILSAVVAGLARHFRAVAISMIDALASRTDNRRNRIVRPPSREGEPVKQRTSNSAYIGNGHFANVEEDVNSAQVGENPVQFLFLLPAHMPAQLSNQGDGAKI
jgi:hypothetical protein